jgi:hypothetical protein
MGIRFACHVCERRLNIKRELAGRRGICPVCAAKIRIPLADAEKSTPVAEKAAGSPVASPASAATPHATAASELAAERELVNGQTPQVSREAGSGESVAPAQAAAAAPVSDLGDQEAASNGLGGSIDLSEENAATWYVRPPSGGQYGPATTEVLRQWIGEGRVASTALLWREGWPQWRDASEALPEFAGRLPDSRSGGVGSGGAGVGVGGPNPAESEVPFATSIPQERSQATADGGGGVADVEGLRRARAIRRVTTISVLSVVALSLILVLAMILNRG